MEKDIDRIPKNPDTDIVIRIDDFGGRVGVTIREFVRSERYSGFTKAGTRISAENFHVFKEAINSINEKELQELAAAAAANAPPQGSYKPNNVQQKFSSGEKSVKKEKAGAVQKDVDEMDFEDSVM